MKSPAEEMTPRERARKLARAAAVHLVWVVLVLATWAAIAYAAYEFIGGEAAFAISAVLLVPTGVLVLHGGNIMSEKFA
ncbi:MAG: hypothetical protein ABEJ42_06000 [Halobacteriaceae archaeon]